MEALRVMNKSISTSHIRSKVPSRPPKDAGKLDRRKQLFNQGSVGPIEEIQVSCERIVQLNGILFDLDPKNYVAGPFTRGLSRDPEKFYKRIVRRWLQRHPTLNNCEVRISGTGLHGILWFQEPIKFENAGDRERWAGIVKVVQAAMPIDSDQPGITATTRDIGSINTKNGATVQQLAEGKPATREEVLTLFEEMCSSPFKTVLKILTGSSSVSPCPVCNGEDTKLTATDYTGRCYGSCGKVKLAQLYDTVLATRKVTDTGKGDHGRKAK
jgi:hypothetical protein